MSDLKALVAARGHLKGSITRLQKSIGDLYSASVEKLKTIKERLKTVFEEYNKTFIEILALDPKDSEDPGIIEDAYYELSSRLDELINKKMSDQPAMPTPCSSKIKLPNVVIPTFTGKYTDYYDFINIFNAMIDNDQSLSPVQKFYYLKGYLSGEPEALIHNLKLNNDSYVEALRLLRDRYDNKTKIIQELINTLLDLPVITRSTTLTLRNIISDVKQHLAALRNLDEPVDSWNSILVCILLRKLDLHTSRAFQMDRDNKSLPTVNELLAYLERRALALENTNVSMQKQQPQRLTSFAVAAPLAASSCLYCKSAHKLFQCPSFKMITPSKRMEFVSLHKLCKICLSMHKFKCKYHFRCAECKKEHNTLLHLSEPQQGSSAIALLSNACPGQVLLPTALVKLTPQFGTTIFARALLDSGSQASFITQKLSNLIGIVPKNSNTTIIGIANAKQTANQCINLDVHSAVYPFKVNVNCHVVKIITTKLPQKYIDITQINLPANCMLADKSFNKPGDVDLLLGADVFFQVLLPQHEKTTDNRELALESKLQHSKQPSIIHTSFGYIVAGHSSLEAAKNKKVVSLICQECDGNLNSCLKDFWKSELVPEIFPDKLPEHKYCEKLFNETTELENNKFQVSLPIKVPLKQVNSELGESFHLAYKRFLNLEKRLQKDPTIFQQYKSFIDQYLELKHGEYKDINSYNLSKDPVCFLPHFPVINNTARSTKLRVVFDGSMLTNKKVSLNNILFNGPVVQKDLFDILLAFRLEKYFFICDIKMMYRCINLNPSHRSLQNILWRESPDEDIKCIQLNTVTYGLKSSSFLATRCLKELADRYKHQFPLASAILQHNTYVDDILVNSHCKNVLINMQNELIQLLDLGGFQLHKWASNCNFVLTNVDKNVRNETEVMHHKSEINVKTLGINFNTQNDIFKSTCPEPYCSQNDSKRDILSYISKFYDPLGLMGPIFVQAKIIMQKLWSSSTNWDDTPPDDIRQLWLDFIKNLSFMDALVIPRCVKLQNDVTIQLIGFADSSSVAYGCALYLRSIDTQGKVLVRLLCSKSRINPLRKELTVPRLELNSAVLLAKLAKRVLNTLCVKIQVKNTYLFSDSQIVLAWIKTDVAKLQPYVANRVRAIGDLVLGCHWQYINTEDNPADCLSRGLQPHELRNHTLWWYGPSFLHCKNHSLELQFKTTLINLPELKNTSAKSTVVCNTTTATDSDIYDYLKRYSSINKMVRVLAYVVRFCNSVKSNATKHRDFLNSNELNTALMMIVKHEQDIHFSSEIRLLNSQKQISGNLKPLTPFLDANGILRVGGRLQNATIPYANQHPAILPKESTVTALIIKNEHIKLLHAGQKLILSSLRQRFWIIDGLRSIKKVIYKCVTCFRMKAEATTQLMGSLPTQRINISRPFSKVGCDFAGPVLVKNCRIRKPLIGKGYIVLFICFATKAIHLELASDLTTESFLAAFKRFIARRNLPSDVHCDNGSTFKGARNQLNELFRLQSSQTHKDQVQNFASSRGINFHFIPSYSPIFGGLWESGVKSTKYHLKRVVGKALLTYEQLNTVLIEIEGVLNSRPLTAISSDVNDFSYLSPGHFLTGAPLNTYPEHDIKDRPISLLKYWSVVVNMKQNFWRYWSKHYLSQLQSRPKWRNVMPNVNIGSLVILCNENISPLQWPMARVTKVYAGKDGHVRTVEVKTANGHTHNRSVTKVCVLPIDM